MPDCRVHAFTTPCLSNRRSFPILIHVTKPCTLSGPPAPIRPVMSHQSQETILFYFLLVCVKVHVIALVGMCSSILSFQLYICSRHWNQVNRLMWPTPSPYEPLYQPRKPPSGTLHASWCTEIVRIGVLSVVLIILGIRNGMEFSNRVTYIKTWHRLPGAEKLCWFW